LNKKNFNSVRNEFGSIWFKKRGWVRILVIYYSCSWVVIITANVTATVYDMIHVTSLCHSQQRQQVNSVIAL